MKKKQLVHLSNGNSAAFSDKQKFVLSEYRDTNLESFFRENLTGKVRIAETTKKKLGISTAQEKTTSQKI